MKLNQRRWNIRINVVRKLRGGVRDHVS